VKRYCCQVCEVESGQKAIWRLPIAIDTPDKWTSTNVRRFNSSKTCRDGSVPMATEAALATLDHAWRVLAPLGHPMAVMGGMALAAWSYLFKLVSGRMIDRADAAMLLRENRDAIDVSYLASWVGRLNLGPQFTQAWTEAYPGDDLPS
jgi:hypothetical protein